MEKLYRAFVSPMVEAYRLGPMQIGASMGRIHSFYLGLKRSESASQTRKVTCNGRATLGLVAKKHALPKSQHGAHKGLQGLFWKRLLHAAPF